MRGSIRSIRDDAGLSHAGNSFFNPRRDAYGKQNDRGTSILGGERPNVGGNTRFSIKKGWGFQNFEP